MGAPTLTADLTRRIEKAEAENARLRHDLLGARLALAATRTRNTQPVTAATS